MYILDTNVISEFFRPAPSEAVEDWIGSVDPSRLFVTAISKAETLLGLALMPSGRRRDGFEQILGSFFRERIKTKVLAFGDDDAVSFAQLVSHRRNIGRPIGEFDAQIASIARTWGYAVVTRNVDDFEHCGIEVINPWEAAG